MGQKDFLNLSEVVGKQEANDIFQSLSLSRTKRPEPQKSDQPQLEWYNSSNRGREAFGGECWLSTVPTTTIQSQYEGNDEWVEFIDGQTYTDLWSSLPEASFSNNLTQQILYHS
ncbi:MAG: hypothetical protein CL912_31175 [Deltaproteobacteria bacterium]|nr:hypothetical protein [Deltaproteobacteria bacterium]